MSGDGGASSGSAAPRLEQRSGHLPGQLDGHVISHGGLVEEEPGGQGFSCHFLAPEDGHHLLGQGPHLGGVPLLETGDDQVEGRQGRIVDVLLGQEGLPRVRQQAARPGGVSQAGGDSSLYPVQTDAVEPSCRGSRRGLAAPVAKRPLRGSDRLWRVPFAAVS